MDLMQSAHVVLAKAMAGASWTSHTMDDNIVACERY